jgi:hypothetical protein
MKYQFCAILGDIKLETVEQHEDDSDAVRRSLSMARILGVAPGFETIVCNREENGQFTKPVCAATMKPKIEMMF